MGILIDEYRRFETQSQRGHREFYQNMRALERMIFWLRGLFRFVPMPRRRTIAPWTSPHFQIQDLEPRLVLVINGLETAAYPAVGIVGDLHYNIGTGTLISSNYVLTAAHVVSGVDNTAAHFIVGGRSYPSERIWINPNYDRGLLGTDAANDIALVRLSEPVTDIAPLPLFRGIPQIGQFLTLVGFGAGGSGISGSNGDFGTKRVGSTPIDTVSHTLIGWRFDHETESNTASGDSGGPAFLTVNGVDYIAGVTSGGGSYGAGLGDTSFDSRVDAYLDWIDSFVGTSDHPAIPLLSLVATDNSATETRPGMTSDRGEFTIQRLDPGNTDLTIAYGVSGTATNGRDYVKLSKTVTIPAGQTKVTLLITPKNDAAVELNETVMITLASSSDYAVEEGLASASITLVDDDRIIPQVSLSVTDLTAAETQWPQATNKAQFTISRTGPLSSPLTVTFTVTGTAKGSVDYIPLPSVITIPARSSSMTIDVIPFDDSIVEPTETVILTLLPGGQWYSIVATSLMSQVNLIDNDTNFIGNDRLAQATVLTGSTISASGDNRNATLELGEPLNAGVSGGKSVWWTWTAPASGSVTLSTAGSSFDTNLGVYTGNVVTSLSRVVDNDDELATSGIFTSRVIFSAKAGTTYRIKVDGFRGFAGTIKLSLTLFV